MTGPYPSTLEKAAALPPREQAFVRRIFGGPQERYVRRLRMLGFAGLPRVLDAGCGYGQWALALAEGGSEVVAIDASAGAASMVAHHAAQRGLARVHAASASVTQLPVASGSIDAVFSYSVLYFTNWPRALAEFHRVLRPGGRLYVNANGVGWFLWLAITGHNASPGYRPRRYAFRSLMNLFRRPATALQVARPMFPGAVVRRLETLGFRTLGCGPDGSVDVTGKNGPFPFFRGRFLGLPAVFEVLAEKTG